MKVDVEFEGFHELDRALQDLPRAAQQRVIRPAFRAGARYIQQYAKARTPVGPTGNLRKASNIKQSRDPGPFGVLFKIGYLARLGAHALIVDKGTGPRRTRDGQNRGRMPARKYFDAAIEAAAQGAALLIQHFWSERLAVEARRLASGQLDARGRLLNR